MKITPCTDLSLNRGGGVEIPISASNPPQSGGGGATPFSLCKMTGDMNINLALAVSSSQDGGGGDVCENMGGGILILILLRMGAQIMIMGTLTLKIQVTF